MRWLGISLVVVLTACGSSEDAASSTDSETGGGGEAPSGGGGTAGKDAGAGGATGKDAGGATGGKASTGGATNTGGNSGTGGATNTGGNSGTGGATNTGGSANTGGSVPSDAGPSVPNCSATPDPAPASTWVNATGNLANMPSECGNLGLVSAKPCSKTVIAGVAQKGLHFTEDGGKTWNQLGTGSGSATITNRISSIVYDPDHPEVFWESGIYNGGGVYKTTDNGVTFVQQGSVTHNDSVSVDLSDPARKTLIAGPHETPQKFYRSTDSGATWTTLGSGLPGGSGYSSATLVLNATTFLIGCAGNGVYRSTDSGSTFTQVGTKGVVFQPLWASSGAVYWPGNGGGVEKGSNQGLGFTEVASSSVAAGVVAPTTLAELPDGRIVAVGKDHLQATADGGATWKAIGNPLPIQGGGYGGAAGVTYSALTKTFFIWRWDCGNVVPADGIWSAGFDYTTP